MKVSKTQIEVRGYELDSYNHVNNAVYISYLEHARWKMLEEAGITLERLTKLNRVPVLAGLQVKYLKPSYMGDQLEIQSQVIESRRVAFKVQHRIVRGTDTILEATVDVVIVNEAGRPAEIPEEVKKLWES